MTVQVFAVGRTDLPPLEMPDRFRREIHYFAAPPGGEGTPETLPEGEHWIHLQEARQYYDDGFLSLVSPLDSDSRAELELSEEQEAWLEWMIENEIEHIRLE